MTVVRFGGAKARLSALLKAVERHDAVENDFSRGLADRVKLAREAYDREGPQEPIDPDVAQEMGRRMRERLARAGGRW